MSNSLILGLFDQLSTPYKKSGSSYVCRCPICKGDSKLKDHNAQINTDTNTLYCFSEQKLYTYAELHRELTGEDYSKIIEKRKENAKLNTERTRTELKEFEKAKSGLIEQGYSVKAVYEYFDLNGRLAYERYRFEKENPDGTKEKILLPCSTDGYASLKGQKQIPYRLEQFLYVNPDEIWLCEGEKCTDSIVANMPSSANLIVLGYTKASDFEGLEFLFDQKEVVIFQDNDSTGKKNTKDLIELFKSQAKSIKVVNFSEFGQGYDVADFLENHNWNELIERVQNAEVVYKSPLSQLTFGKKTFLEKEERFILEPFLPTKAVTLFDALGESGKSLFALQMCMCLASGRQFLGLPVVDKKRILYIVGEETDYDFNERMEKIQKALQVSDDDLKNIAWISILSKDFQCSTYSLLDEAGKGIEKTEFYEYLKTIISQWKPDLVVLDSLGNFYALDENSTRHGLKFMESLKMLIRDYGCSFLLIHHQNKEAMKKDGEKIFRGTITFREQARCRFYIEKVSDDVKRVVIEKLNKPTIFSREYYVRLATSTENLEPCLSFILTDPPPTKEVRVRKNGSKKEEIEEFF